MPNEKEVKSVLAIDPGAEKGDVTVSQSVYKAGEDFTPGGLEDVLVLDGVISEVVDDLREWKNYEAFREIILDPSGLGCFDRIKQVIIEKDIRIFDKMSRRCKKVYISRLTYYEASTGKYTTRKYKGHPGFKPRPMRWRWTEVHGCKMETLFKDWFTIL